MVTTVGSAPLFRIDRIDLDLPGRTATEVIRDLHKGLRGLDAVIDADGFLRDVTERHALKATCLDQEIALAHARTTAVTRFVFAIGRAESGVCFDDAHRAVRLVFLVGFPLSSGAQYLHWAARLVRSLRDPVLRQTLLTTTDVAEVRRLWPESAGENRRDCAP